MPYYSDAFHTVIYDIRLHAREIAGDDKVATDEAQAFFMILIGALIALRAKNAPEMAELHRFADKTLGAGDNGILRAALEANDKWVLSGRRQS